MSLFSVDVQKFRAFRERATVDYRPLTMFYGHNQAGKSSVLRLLPLLADSIYESHGALNMTSASLASQNFKELGHISGAGGIPASPILHLKKTSPTTSELELQFGDEGGLIVNRLRLFKLGNEVMDVTWEKTEERRGNSSTARYQGKVKGQTWDGNIKFDNLFPAMMPTETTSLIEELRQAFAPLQRLQWLRANRIRLDGQATSRSRCCASDGSDIASVMPERERKKILDSAAKWLQLQDNLANSISIDAQQKIQVGTGRVDLPLYLAGEGLRALLPILLCACWAENKDDFAPTMLALEEPEAHLHPHLQAALFDRLIKTIENGVPVALETHSVYMLRAMQLAILNKQIKPEDVALYWVEQMNGQATLTKIDVQADGTLHNWRPDVFEKEQELAQQILERRWAMGSVS